MTRRYFCWKVCLTFGCGCVEYTPTAHLCGPEREGCNTWMTCKRTDKDCEDHRAGRWGLHSRPSLSLAEEGYSGSSGSKNRSADVASNAIGVGGNHYHRHRRHRQRGEEEEQEEGRAMTVAQRAEGGVQGRETGESGGEEGANWEGYYTRRRE